jgi:tellurite resistance protein
MGAGVDKAGASPSPSDAVSIECPLPEERMTPIHLNKPIPVAFFGMVLGLSGLGIAWRLAAQLWGLPAAVGESVLLLATAVWIVLVILYGAKWIWARQEALAEFRHPVLCCFVGIVPVSTALVALAIHPYVERTADFLAAIGIVGQLVFGVYRTGRLWMGDRDPATTTPVLYLPAVAGSFVSTLVLVGFGYPEWGAPFFGIGMLSWLAIESVLLQRLYTSELPPPLRPTLGIQLAPPLVGCSAYLALTSGPPDLFAQALLGYGVFQVLLLGRLLPWITRQPFAASYWAFTFGLAALAVDGVRFAARSTPGPISVAAPYLLGLVSIAIGAIALGTLWLLLQGRLIPLAAAPPRESLHPTTQVR